MSLSTIANKLLKFAPGLNLDLVKSIIQSSYEELCGRDWSQLKLQRQITTVAPYSTGTVAVATDGTVTGSSTVFNSAMVGRFMRVYYDDSLFEIESVTSQTELKLKDWTGEVVDADTSYSILKTIYPVNSDFGLIFDVIYQTALTKKSQSYFNRIDPGRTSTGDAPIFWAYAGKNDADAILIEIYPPVTSAVPLRVYGKMKAVTLEDDDTPKLPEALVAAHALIECYAFKARQQPKQGWEERQTSQEGQFASLLIQYEDEDFQLDSHPGRVRDTSSEPLIPSDDNFSLSHDVD